MSGFPQVRCPAKPPKQPLVAKFYEAAEGCAALDDYMW
jgi:hypothetical protein